MYLLHKSDSGSFQELAHKLDVEFGQLSLLTVAPRHVRGHHYHTCKKEWFCCLHGKCYIVTTNIRTGKQESVGLNEDNREFVLVNPYDAHVVLNPYEQECELLVISSEEYDPENPDTIRYEAVKEVRRELVLEKV